MVGRHWFSEQLEWGDLTENLGHSVGTPISTYLSSGTIVDLILKGLTLALNDPLVSQVTLMHAPQTSTIPKGRR